jgi:selenocysteine lyase/cysteine desulfurase
MVSRRESLSALIGGPLLLTASAATANPASAAGPKDVAALARNFRRSGTFINAAYTHPLPLDAAAAQRAMAETRADPFHTSDDPPHRSKPLFAHLVNAAPEEIAWIPSTSYGESFVIGALGLKDGKGGKVVTDILHFDGSLYTYGELAKRGLGVTVLPMTADGRIDMNRLEAAVDDDTRLVAVSLVSMVNGFQHDLKTVCDIAHRKGALVYADVIQAAGAIPIDVKISGVDFIACSSFKWLMGDFGCGFLYANREVFGRLKRSEFGYHQIRTLAYHVLPGDAPGPTLFEATPEDGSAAGLFEVGSLGYSAEAAVSVSLQNLLNVGVDRIAAARQPLMDRLRERLDGRYASLTPKGSTSPIVAYAMQDTGVLSSRLKEAGIVIQVYDNRFRISPSVYNTMADIDRLTGVLIT